MCEMLLPLLNVDGALEPKLRVNVVIDKVTFVR